MGLVTKHNTNNIRMRKPCLPIFIGIFLNYLPHFVNVVTMTNQWAITVVNLKIPVSRLYGAPFATWYDDCNCRCFYFQHRFVPLCRVVRILAKQVLAKARPVCVQRRPEGPRPVSPARSLLHHVCLDTPLVSHPPHRSSLLVVRSVLEKMRRPGVSFCRR